MQLCNQENSQVPFLCNRDEWHFVTLLPVDITHLSSASVSSHLMMAEAEMSQFHPLNEAPPPTNTPRSIDNFLEAAYRHQSEFAAVNNPSGGCLSLSWRLLMQRWRYYITFLALGIANSGDSAEMGCTNYILSSETFQHDVSMFWYSCLLFEIHIMSFA